MAKSKSAAVVIKKKRWIRILASKLFNNQPIGESFVSEPNDLVGRCVSVSLMILTGDPQRQASVAKFKIIGVENDVVNTEFLGYALLPSATKKLMRRAREKVDDSFLLETADKKIVRVKPYVVTRGRTTGGVMATMRKLTRAYLARAISKLTFEQLVAEVFGKRLQHGLGQVLRKLYPIGACEIRDFKLVSAEKVKEMGWAVMTPPAEEPKVEPKESAKEEQPAEKAEQPASEQSA